MRRLSIWRNGLLAIAGFVAAAAYGVGEVSAQAPGDWDGLVNRINRLQEQIYDLRDGTGGAVQLQGNQIASDPSGNPADDASLSLRLNRLEEQMRNLTGQIEQMVFQVQQLNERFTRMSEDVEFRFQEMGSGKRGDADSTRAPAPLDTLPPPSTTASIDTQSGSLLGSSGQLSAGGSFNTEPPPRTLGTIPADALRGGSQMGGSQLGGSLQGGSIQQGSLVPEEVTSQPLGSVGGNGAGAAPAAGGPEQLYKQTHEQLLRRQFDTAEVGFKQFLKTYPDHELAGNAQYWLGETFYARRQYKLAAEAFLKGYQDYSKGAKAADSLVKLGMTLNRLGQQKQACAALVEAERRYPKAQEVRKIAAQERSRNGC
jgi:tol-pal system protein YbgF